MRSGGNTANRSRRRAADGGALVLKQLGNGQFPVREQFRHGEDLAGATSIRCAAREEYANLFLFGIDDPDSQRATGEQQIDFAVEVARGFRRRDYFDGEFGRSYEIVVAAGRASAFDAEDGDVGFYPGGWI